MAPTRYSFLTKRTTRPPELVLNGLQTVLGEKFVVFLKESISGRRQAPPRTMDTRWRREIYKIMIVFSNHSMVLDGAWLLPDTCLVKLTTISRGLSDGPPSQNNRAGLVPQAVVRLD